MFFTSFSHHELCLGRKAYQMAGILRKEWSHKVGRRRSPSSTWGKICHHQVGKGTWKFIWRAVHFKREYLWILDTDDNCNDNCGLKYRKKLQYLETLYCTLILTALNELKLALQEIMPICSNSISTMVLVNSGYIIYGYIWLAIPMSIGILLRVYDHPLFEWKNTPRRISVYLVSFTSGADM